MQRSVLSTALLALTPLGFAQWSSDPAENLAVGAGPSDQILPKIAPTADGGCYIAWFDGIANGYDVRLQRLDANGVEQWPSGGVLVADRSFSSVQDYGLGVHAGGDALVTYRDDQSGSIRIAAQRVSISGNLAWGAGGVQLSAAGHFVTAPKIVGAASGEVVAAWMENGTTRVMRLLEDGSSAWAAPLDLVPPAGSYTPSDMHAAGEDVLLSIVHQTGSSFGSPKHLLAQKVGPTGAFLWGAQPVAVFDGGSLQIGNFPSFVPDGSGGAVFSWYGVSPLQCYAQRIRADGTAAFAHNGAAASSDLSNLRVSPAAAFDRASSSTYLFWKEQNSLQSLAGLYGQRFDASGNPQWGATGKELVAVSSTQVDWVRTLYTATGAFVFWIASPAFGQDVGRGAVVDSAGNFVVPPKLFASTPSSKTRLAAARDRSGDAILAWGDARNDGGDVLAQNFGPDGGLGSGPAFSAYCFGVGCPCGLDAPASGCPNQSGAGALLAGSGSPSLGADTFVLTATGLLPFELGVFFQGDDALGGGAGTPFRDGLLCAAGGELRLVLTVSDGAGCAASDGSCGTPAGGAPGPISSHPSQPFALTPGTVKRYQFWYRDPAGLCVTGSNLSNGLTVVWN